MLNFVHGDLYSTALALTKKFTLDNGMRPILQYTRHAEGGRMEATDAHRAIMIHNIHGFKEDYLIHPKTFAAATGTFPDLSQVFDVGEHEHILTLSKEKITLWLQLFRSINNTLKTIKTVDNRKCVHLIFKKDFVKVELHGLDVKMELPADIVNHDTLPIAVNAEYMRDAMEVFSKMESKEIKIRLRGSFRPIHFIDDGKVEVLVLPIRTGYEIKED